MDILGIGFPELIFILVIALMVFGPRRLPELAAKAGKFVGDLRNMSNGLLAEWQREIRASELHDELTKTREELVQARDAVNVAKRELTEQSSEVAKTITPPKIDGGKLLAQEASNLEQAVSPNPQPKPKADEAPVPGGPQPPAENSIAPPQDGSNPNGVETNLTVISPDSEKLINGQ